MATIYPFQAYRYSAQAGALPALVTQPYDKISPDMQRRYLQASPYNLVRIILGERFASDSESENVYTRAARYLSDWIAQGMLARDTEPALFAYFQEFAVPDTGERLVRKGFIGLGAVEEYAAGVVHRHEQTLSGPKKDRLELLRHTHAHFGQLFMLYPDPAGEIDRLLDEAAQAAPLGEVTDEYGVRNVLWRIAQPDRVARIRESMADKKLLIADGHHRYETALAFRRENPGLAGADRVMMTFVNMHSPGLKILATHRLVSGVAGFDAGEFIRQVTAGFEVAQIPGAETLQRAWAESPGRTIIGAAMGTRLYMIEARDSAAQLDVRVLHERLLRLLGIGEEAVRDEKNLRYVRGLDAALEAARSGAAQVAFLLKPVDVGEVARISFGGGVMPQKSTDFYPKLLSGLTIYKLD
ncbi:MAG TPA: DUF1015 domain-containing protein [Bryobacteraceae bacterium]|nr:DUF1015 domain-containing protein [Bryobacteraceae bacterium]